MNDTLFGLVSSIYMLGGLLGALSAGPFSTRKGRLLPMRLTTLFFILGPILESLAPAIWVMAVGRFLSGAGAGAAIVVVPIYTAEIAPKQTKGLFGASTQVMINVGIVTTQVLGYLLSSSNMWRVVLATAGAIGILQLAGLFTVPESPEWLAAKGQVNPAKKVLAKLRGRPIDDEFGDRGTTEEGEGTDTLVLEHRVVCGYKLYIANFHVEEYESLLGSENGQTNSSKKKKAEHIAIGIFEVAIHPSHYKAIVAVTAVMLAQQLCGVNSIIMYSASLLSELLPTTAGLITVGVGVLNLIVTVACAPLADKLGRKICLLLSIAGMGVNSLLLACGILFRVKVLSAVATLLFVASFAVGLGPVPFILSSELAGPEAVGATQSWALATSWIATFLVAQFFPILNKALGKGRVYFVFAALAAASFAFIAWWVPETRGKKDADEVWGRERRED